MSQVVLRGGGFLPITVAATTNGDTVKTQTEPEKQDILVMDTKLKIIEILQVKHVYARGSCNKSEEVPPSSLMHSHVTLVIVHPVL